MWSLVEHIVEAAGASQISHQLRPPHPHVLCLCQVSLFNYVFLVSWAFALPFSQFRPLASSVCTVWTCVIVVCKMLYQLTSINPSSYSRSCTMVSPHTLTRDTQTLWFWPSLSSLLQPENYTDAQRSDMARSLLYSGPVDPANWIGLKKFSPLLENLRVRTSAQRLNTVIGQWTYSAWCCFYYYSKFYP